MDTFIGKHVLIGITFKDTEGRIADMFQTHGHIIEIHDNALIVERIDGSGPFSLPPGVETLKPAPPGSYHVRDTGDVVVDPDFLIYLTVASSDPAVVARYKSDGFETAA